MVGERVVVELHHLAPVPAGAWRHTTSRGVEVEFRRTSMCETCEAGCAVCGEAHCGCCGERRPEHLAVVHELGEVLCGVCLGMRLGHGACAHETGQLATKAECAEKVAPPTGQEEIETVH